MRDHDSFQRWAALAAIISMPVALASIFLPLPAIEYDVATFADPLSLLRRGAAAAGLMRASLLADMLGYYLLIAPLVMVLRTWLEPRARAWSRLFTGSLLVYVVVGAAGAAVLAAASPRLMIAHGAATSADQRFALEALYNTLWDSIYGGLWNIFEELVAGVGWLGIGLLLRRDRPVLGVVTIVLGAACLLDGIGNIFAWKTAADAGLYVYLLLAPAWALAFGITLLRHPVPTPVSATVLA
jgi:hypothetical protein